MFTTSTNSMVNENSCSTSRFPIITTLIEFANNFDAHIPQSLHAIELQQIELEANQKKKKLIPVSLEISRQKYKTDDSLVSQSRETEIDEISGRVGLDLWNEATRRNRLTKTADLDSYRLRALKNQMHAEILTSLLEISVAKALKNKLLARDNLLTKKVEFFELKKELGDSVSQELLEARTKQVENLNKLNASDVRITTLSTKIKLPQIATDKVPLINSNLDVNNKFSCTGELLSYHQSVAERKLNEALLTESAIDMLPKVYGFANKTKSSNDSLANRYETRYGVEINVPLFNGGKKIVDHTILNKKIDAYNSNNASLKEEGEQRIKQQQEIEFIYKKNIITIETNLENLQTKMNELLERYNLGQSVFLEMTNTLIEISLLEETKIRVIGEHLINWINFLEVLDKLDYANAKI